MSRETAGRFCFVDIELSRERWLRASKWEAQKCYEERTLQNLVNWHRNGFLWQALEKADTNGIDKFCFATDETIFTLPQVMFPRVTNKNRKLQRGLTYKIVGLLNECVLGEDDRCVVPKFALFRNESSNALQIRNYDRYLHWCKLLRNNIKRAEDGVMLLEWTRSLQESAEDIYHLQCSESATFFPVHLMTLLEPGDTRSWYTVASLEGFGHSDNLQLSTNTPSLATLPFGLDQSYTQQQPTIREKLGHLCVCCIDEKATYLMESCRHLTHCADCRRIAIDYDRKKAGRYHEGVGPSEKLNKKNLASYTINCSMCRKHGRLVLWKKQVVYLP